MAKKNNLSEAKRQLDDFTSKCSKSKVLAHELGLAQSEEKMNQLLGETVLVAAKAHLDEAVNISGSDMKKAKAVALEAAEILRNHPIPQPFEAARASILNAVNEFVRRGITTVPPTPDAKGTPPPTADAGAAGPSDSDAVNKIVARAEKLLSKKKYADARKAVAELVKMAKENSDAELEKRASDLVEKIRAEEFKGLEEKVTKENEVSGLLTEEEVENYLKGLMEKTSKEKNPDVIGALRSEVIELHEENKKEIAADLAKAKEDSHELEMIKKMFLDRFSKIEDDSSKRMDSFPWDARKNVTVQSKPPADLTELKVFFYELTRKDAVELKKFISEWK
jgi:hypothetical protein